MDAKDSVYNLIENAYGGDSLISLEASVLNHLPSKSAGIDKFKLELKNWF